LPQEYEVDASALPFTPLPDGDVYAAEVGWSAGFPVGRDPKRGKAWMAHCYGVVGVGRDMPPDTGLGNELYAVSGHAPRHLDRNLAMVGRVVAGMPLLTALPRGTGPLGFYERAEQRVTITRVRMASDAPAAEQPGIELLRTDTKTWSAYVASRRFRNEGFFVAPTGKVELCNVAVPTR
jgi:peptidylprolyl isomerase